MSSPEELRQVTEKTLHSLIADESLKFRILQKAASSEQNDSSRRKNLIPAFCTILAVLLIAAVSLNSIRTVPASVPGELNSFTAGGTDSDIPLLFPEGFHPDTVVSIEMENVGTVDDPEQCAALANILLHQSVQVAEPDSVIDGKLFVTTSEGQIYTFHISDPYLTGGNHICWSCPGFFSDFNKMVE